MTFWNKLALPIIGLSPMDGITDAPFRQIVDEIGKPSILFTEFVSAEEIEKGAERVLYALSYHNTKTPIVAQLFGSHPDAMYKAALVACALGFNGIDINMGCPDKKVILKGGGAGLIKNPKLAQLIIKSVQKASQDWHNGIDLNNADIHKNILNYLKDKNLLSISRLKIPISVKTRVGFEKPITEDWIFTLVECKPDAISLHGRTLKQLYTGLADWEEISKAEKIVHKSNIIFLGNGDIKSLDQAQTFSKKYNLDGVLIGRACLGNPWIFSNFIPSMEEVKKTMLKHAELVMQFRPDLQLMPLRKHLAWYCKGFVGAAEIRNKLTKVTTIHDLQNILTSISL